MSDLGVAVVIEDDTDMRNLLEGVLVQSGFHVHVASSGREGVELVRDKAPEVVTLDVGLPDIDGFEVLRRIRGFSDTYVVMLTGRTEEPDLLTALHSGADDYITKPFRPREMRARILAMLRRPRQQLTGGSQPAPQPEPVSPEAPRQDTVLRHNGLALDYRMRTVTVSGVGLELTRSEFDLLHELLRGGGAVLSRTQLVWTLRGEYSGGGTYVSESDERAVEVHIGNLRRKLRDDPVRPRWLQTVRGVGYCLAKESQKRSD
ncbi:response regulator transcription factor [Pseudarthrobacter sp. CCNWLW207]|uniref:response regulator transcription factor n=1 Tax=Pseudarthrobacter sp. CCNWLW207 TaxID=3127468 RepID=UPI003076B032